MSDEQIDIIVRVKDSASGPTKEITRNIKDLDTQAQGTTSRGLAGLEKAVGVGLKAAVAVGTAAIIGFGSVIGSSISKAADMEQGVANISANMGLAADETAALKDLISDLGLDPKLKVTATEAAEAIGVLGTAGFDVNQIMDGAARSTVLLANSTGAAFGQAGSIISDVSAQFDIDAKDMAGAVDAITGVTVASKFGINDYADAIAQAGGVASSVGLGFDDFNAIIAGTAFNFKGGSDAGTSLKTFLTSLIPNSNAAADAMRDLGLYTGLTGKEFEDAQGKLNKVKERIAELDPTSKNYAEKLSKLRAEQTALTASMVEGGSAFFDANGMMRSGEEIQAALIHSTQGLSEAKLNDAFATIFGQDASRTAFALIKEGVPTIEEMKGVIGDTSAEESAAIRMDTFSGAMEIALGIIDTISMSIGDKFLPVLRPLVEKFTELAQTHGPQIVDFFGGVADKVGAFIDVLIPGSNEVTKISDALSGTTGILSDLSVTTEDISEVMAGFTDSLGGPGQAAGETIRHLLQLKDTTVGITEPVVNLVTQFISWKDVLAAVGVVIATMLYPAISAFLGIAAPAVAIFAGLVVASALLRNSWESDFLGIRSAIIFAWDIISGVFNSVALKVGWIVETFKAQWAVLAAVNATLGEKLGLIWTTIQELAHTAWQGIVTTVAILLPPFITKLQEWGAAAWQWISEAMPVAWAKIEEWGAGIWQWVTDNTPQWIATLQAWGIAAWQWIIDAIPVAVGKLKEWGASIFQWVGNNLPNFIKTVLEWGVALYAWIGDAIPKAIDGLTNFIKGIRARGDGDGKTSLVQMAGGWTSTLWQWITEDLIPAVGPAFMDFIKAMLNLGGKLLVSIGNLARELGSLLWEWIVEVTPIAVKQLGEWGRSLIDWVRASLPGWMTQLRKWGVAIWDWIKEAIPETAGKIEEWHDKIVEWITKLREQVQTKMDWIRDNVIEPVKEFIKDTKDKILEWKDWIIEKYEYLKTEIPKKMEWIKVNVIEPVKEFVDKTMEKIKPWYDWVIEKFTAIHDWLKVNFDPTDWKKTGENVIDGLRDGLEIAWIRLSNWFFSNTAFGGFVGDIMELLGVQLGPAYGVLHKNGENIAYSLNEGSRYGLPTLKQTGSDMGTAISSGLEKNMEINSPSRVMWGYGEDIMAGLQGGVRTGFTALKSEMQFVADTIKATMKQANDEMLAGIEYFSNQALVRAQAAHYKIANAAIDAGAILKKLGIDASQAVGFGPNGELILKGVTNLPKVGDGKTSGALDYAGASDMLDAMNNWKKFFLSSKDPMNDYLGTIKGLIANAPQDIQNGVDRWLQTWKTSGDPLNDYFENVKNAVSAKIKSGIVSPMQDFTTIGQALGADKATIQGQGTAIELLGGIKLQAADAASFASKEAVAIQSSVKDLVQNLSQSISRASNLIPQSGSEVQYVIDSMLADLVHGVKQAAKEFTDADTTNEFKLAMTDFYKFITEKITTSKSALVDSSASQEVQKEVDALLKDLRQQLATGSALTQAAIGAADTVKKAPSTVENFIGGFVDFLKGTLEGAGSVFQHFKYQEEKALKKDGNLLEYIGSEQAQTKTQLTGLYKGIQNNIADLLGISPSELNVTSKDSLRLIDRVGQVLAGTSAESSMDIVGGLLQELVNFRNLANSGTGKGYFENVLPTDSRLTGGNTTTNHSYTIQVQGSGNASADIMSTVQLLNQLTSSAIA